MGFWCDFICFWAGVLGCSVVCGVVCAGSGLLLSIGAGIAGATAAGGGGLLGANAALGGG